MNQRPTLLKPVGPSSLADEEDFWLGAMQVRPSLREVEAAGVRESLEPRVMQVLVALAGAGGAVLSRDELIRQCWGGRIVGEDAINRCVAKVRQISELGGGRAFDIETISRVGYRLIAVQSSANVVQTSQIPAASAKVPSLESASGSQTLDVRKFILSTAIAAALIMAAAAVLFGARSTRPSPNPRAPGPQVQATAAVLPFTPLYTDKNAQIYADEISSDVADTLGQTDLNIVSPALSFRFRGDVKAGAAKALHADILVDGDVRREANNLVVAVRVEDVASGLVLLSKDIVAPVAQATELPDRVATFIAGALGWDFSIRALNSGRQWDPRVRTGVLRGLFQCPHRQDPFCAYEVGRKLVSIAPDNAIAQTILAIETTNILDRLPPRERRPAAERARKAAWSAIRLDPHFGEPYIALSQLAPDMAANESYLRRGLSVDPDSSSVAGFLSALLYSAGRSKEGLSVIERVATRYKFQDWSSTNQIWALLALGRRDEAVEIARRARRLWPGTQLFVLMLFDAAAFEGNPKDAEALLTDPVTGPILHSPGKPPLVPDLTRALRTRRTEDIEVMSHDCAHDPRDWLRTHLCLPALAMLGRIDDAFQLPANADAENVLFWPQTARLRADPRFLGWTEKLGLLAYWRGTHSRPDFCAAEKAAVCQALSK